MAWVFATFLATTLVLGSIYFVSVAFFGSSRNAKAFLSGYILNTLHIVYT